MNKKVADEIWIIPCKKHAFNKSLASSMDRIRMIKLAIKGLKNVKINNIELNSKEKSYTYNTIRKLKKRYKHEFFLIIGSDITHELKKWKNYKQLLEETKFIVFSRPGYDIKKVRGMKIIKIISRVGNISSTNIRERVMKKRIIRGLVEKAVENYIINKKLYAK